MRTVKVRGSYIMTCCCLRVVFLPARCGFRKHRPPREVVRDADTGDTAEVAPEKEVLVRKTRASLDRQTRQSGSPPVLDVAGLGGVEVRARQRLVLTDSHLSATDADTLLAGVVDPSKITFRISAITGGKLQRLLPSGALGGHDAGDR